MTVLNYNEIIAKARAGEKPPTLLDDRMFQVCAQISMHDRPRAAHRKVGARGVPYSSASMQTRKLCDSGARRSSIPSAR